MSTELKMVVNREREREREREGCNMILVIWLLLLMVYDIGESVSMPECAK